MDKKNIQPQQQKPVVRQNVAKEAIEGLSEEQLTVGWIGAIAPSVRDQISMSPPFAGDDAE